MLKMYFTVATLLIFCTSQLNGESSHVDVEAAWQNYQANFPMEIQTKAEYGNRKENFVKTHYEITEHNNNAKATYRREHNIFSVMDDEEKKNFMGANRPRPIEGSRYLTNDDVSMRQLPTSVDYRTNICMQPVKNQGGCGSCWAFSATAVVEFGKCVLNGTKIALSEQQLVDCNASNSGCGGGWMDYAWTYLAGAGGHATAASYPYTSTVGTCKLSTAVKGARISKTSPVTAIGSRNTTTMMTLLSQKRLISTVIAVVNSFLSYKSGVYAEAKCGESILGYHAMVMVGYGTLNDVNYWVIRNSWGSGWGGAGYVLFQRDINLCNIEDWAMTTSVVG